MRTFPMAMAVLLAVTVSACVTINIYFPAAAAEKAADKIIEEVWQLKNPGEKGADTQAPAKSDVQPQK